MTKLWHPKDCQQRLVLACLNHLKTMFEPPPPTKYNFLSLWAGVQSSCLALMAAKGETATSVPYLHPALVPLDKVDFRTDEEMGQMQLWNTIQAECAGMCGV